MQRLQTGVYKSSMMSAHCKLEIWCLVLNFRLDILPKIMRCLFHYYFVLHRSLFILYFSLLDEDLYAFLIIDWWFIFIVVKSHMKRSPLFCFSFLSAFICSFLYVFVFVKFMWSELGPLSFPSAFDYIISSIIYSIIFLLIFHLFHFVSALVESPWNSVVYLVFLFAL